jgi:hypothetical protein
VALLDQAELVGLRALSAKPRIVLRDAVNHVIEIVEHAQPAWSDGPVINVCVAETYQAPCRACFSARGRPGLKALAFRRLSPPRDRRMDRGAMSLASAMTHDYRARAEPARAVRLFHASIQQSSSRPRHASCRSINKHMLRSLVARGAVVAAAIAAVAGAPAGARAADVAFFDNATYVDNANPGGEATNLKASLAAAGHAVHPFTGIAAADLTTALAGQDALAISEQEKPRTLRADLTPGAKQVLRDFVSAGGNFVTFGQHKAVLDAVFGFTISTTGPLKMTGGADKDPAAASTPYAAGPAWLPANDGVYAMPVSALPTDAKVVYRRTQASVAYAVVVFIPYGAGTITYLGWDWWGSNPPFTNGGADGGWQGLLNLAVGVVPAPTVAPPGGATGSPTQDSSTEDPEDADPDDDAGDDFSDVPGDTSLAAAVCRSRRILHIHVKGRRGAKLRATINGKRVAIGAGKVVVDLRNRAPGRYRVVVRNAKGRALTVRTLRTCVFS